MPGLRRYDLEIIQPLGVLNFRRLGRCSRVLLFVEADRQVTEARAMLDRLSGQLEALLGAFELESVAAAESLSERLEASRGRLEAIVKGAAKDDV